MNEGIGGNEVVGPPRLCGQADPGRAFGARSAAARRDQPARCLDRHLARRASTISAPGGASAQAVSDGVREGVKRLRASIPGVRIYMATLTGALNSTPTHGTPEVEAKRKEYNQFIRSAGIFDGVIDFDVVTLDPATGELKAVYQPNSTVGGPGDKLHPNRAGYAAMGNAIDLQMIVGK